MSLPDIVLLSIRISSSRPLGHLVRDVRDAGLRRWLGPRQEGRFI